MARRILLPDLNVFLHGSGYRIDPVESAFPELCDATLEYALHSEYTSFPDIAVVWWLEGPTRGEWDSYDRTDCYVRAPLGLNKEGAFNAPVKFSLNVLCHRFDYDFWRYGAVDRSGKRVVAEAEFDACNERLLAVFKQHWVEVFDAEAAEPGASRNSYKDTGGVGFFCSALLPVAGPRELRWKALAEKMENVMHDFEREMRKPCTE